MRTLRGRCASANLINISSLDSGSDKNCDVDIARLTTYGYVQSEQVSISAGGTETTFSAQAQHEEGTKTFAIDANGKITEVDGKESKAR